MFLKTTSKLNYLNERKTKLTFIKYISVLILKKKNTIIENLA